MAAHAIDRFIRQVRRVSLLCGFVAAALIAAGVLVVCEMVFVRYALKGKHDLADRFRHLLPDRRDVHRQSVRADDARPCQRRRAAALRRGRAAVRLALFGPLCRSRSSARHDGAHLPVLEKLGQQLGVRHDVAGATVDPVRSMPSGSASHLQCSPDHQLVTGASRRSGKATAEDLARASLKPKATRREPEQGRWSSVTLLVLLSGAPVAFGSGAIASSLHPVLFQGWCRCMSSPRLLFRAARLHPGFRSDVRDDGRGDRSSPPARTCTKRWTAGSTGFRADW
jgi:hypothetical protein